VPVLPHLLVRARGFVERHDERVADLAGRPASTSSFIFWTSWAFDRCVPQMFAVGR
jgi:hypothetical protein